MKWIIIGAVVLIALHLLNNATAPADAPATVARAGAVQSAPTPKVEIIGFDCLSHRTGTDMRGSLRNTSGEPLERVKIYADFDGQVYDGYINELTLHPGNVSTFLIPGPSAHAGECRILYAQDRHGRRIS